MGDGSRESNAPGPSGAANGLTETHAKSDYSASDSNASTPAPDHAPYLSVIVGPSERTTASYPGCSPMNPWYVGFAWQRRVSLTPMTIWHA